MRTLEELHEYGRVYRLKNKDKIKSRYLKNPLIFKRRSFLRNEKDKDSWSYEDLIKHLRSDTIALDIFTGMSLDLTDGTTFHLDHFKSRAKGGDSELSNLCAVSSRCNLVKGTLDGEDFIKKAIYHQTMGITHMYYHKKKKYNGPRLKPETIELYRQISETWKPRISKDSSALCNWQQFVEAKSWHFVI